MGRSRSASPKPRSDGGTVTQIEQRTGIRHAMRDRRRSDAHIETDRAQIDGPRWVPRGPRSPRAPSRPSILKGAPPRERAHRTRCARCRVIAVSHPQAPRRRARCEGEGRAGVARRVGLPLALVHPDAGGHRSLRSRSTACEDANERTPAAIVGITRVTALRGHAGPGPAVNSGAPYRTVLPYSLPGSGETEAVRRFLRPVETVRRRSARFRSA